MSHTPDPAPHKSVGFDDARRDLLPVAPLLLGILQKAERDFNALPPELAADYSLTTRASICHDHMVKWARRLQHDNPRFNCRRINGLDVLFFQGSSHLYAIRMKKLDKGKRSRNIRTGQVQSFCTQKGLDGFEGVCCLDLGYRLSDCETCFSGFDLVCRRGAQYDWAIDLEAYARPCTDDLLGALPSADTDKKEDGFTEDGFTIERRNEQKKGRFGS